MQVYNLSYNHVCDYSSVLFKFIGCTLFVAVFSAICQINFDLLVFDRPAVQIGEYWRLVSAHFTHNSFSHGFFNVLAFSVSVTWLSVYSVRVILPSVIAGIVTVSALLLSSWSSLDYYCGLSGILFSPLIVAACLHAKTYQSLLGFVPLLVVLTKLIVDLMVQDAAFVNVMWPVYPESHLAGALAGLLMIIGLYVIKIFRKN